MNEETEMPHGVLSIDYAYNRKKSLALRYRAQRRTSEVIKAIERYFTPLPKTIIDLGTADGYMLAKLQETYSSATCLGVEYNQDLINYGKTLYPHLSFKQADIQQLDF